MYIATILFQSVHLRGILDHKRLRNILFYMTAALRGKDHAAW